MTTVPRRIGCPLCAARAFASVRPLEVFGSASALRQHCVDRHHRQLTLAQRDLAKHQPAINTAVLLQRDAELALASRPSQRPFTALHDAITTTSFAAALSGRQQPGVATACDGLPTTRPRPSGAAVRDGPSTRPVSAVYDVGDVAAHYASVAVADPASTSARRTTSPGKPVRLLRAMVIVDMANVHEHIFPALHGIDPSAEVTLDETEAWFVCVCEPCVDIAGAIGSSPYAMEMLRMNRLFVHRTHGGSEAADLVIADLIARVGVEVEMTLSKAVLPAAVSSEGISASAEECPHPPPPFSDGDEEQLTGDGARPFTVHLVTNDRRLAKGVKAVAGLSTPIIEHHAFEKTDAAWRDALLEMLHFCRRSPLPQQ